MPVDLGVAKRTMLDTTEYGPNAMGSLVRFGLLALVPLIALGAVLARELNVDLQQRYLETARISAALITQVGIQPLLSAQLVEDGLSFTDVATIDDKLRGAAVSKDVRRIKVWNKNGTVVYSDNHALIGRTFLPDDDLRAALSGHSSASITNGHDEETSGDNRAGPLIRVYVPLVFAGTSSAAGAFELYLPYAPVQAAIDSESNQLYLLLAAGLTVFYVSMFPVVLLADRLRRRLLNQAQDAAVANVAALERLNAVRNAYLTRIRHSRRPTASVADPGEVGSDGRVAAAPRDRSAIPSARPADGWSFKPTRSIQGRFAKDDLMRLLMLRVCYDLGKRSAGVAVGGKTLRRG